MVTKDVLTILSGLAGTDLTPLADIQMSIEKAVADEECWIKRPSKHPPTDNL